MAESRTNVEELRRQFLESMSPEAKAVSERVRQAHDRHIEPVLRAFFRHEFDGGIEAFKAAINKAVDRVLAELGGGIEQACRRETEEQYRKGGGQK